MLGHALKIKTKIKKSRENFSDTIKTWNRPNKIKFSSNLTSLSGVRLYTIVDSHRLKSCKLETVHAQMNDLKPKYTFDCVNPTKQAQNWIKIDQRHVPQVELKFGRHKNLRLCWRTKQYFRHEASNGRPNVIGKSPNLVSPITLPSAIHLSQWAPIRVQKVCVHVQNKILGTEPPTDCQKWPKRAQTCWAHLSQFEPICPKLSWERVRGPQWTAKHDRNKPQLYAPICLT